MSVLFLSIIQLTSFYFADGNVLVYNSETPQYFLLTILLGIGVCYALFDRLNAKTTLLIYGAYFGISLLTGLINVFSLPAGVSPVMFIARIALNLICLVLCVCFFAGKKIASPVPVYVACGVYAIVGSSGFFASVFSGLPAHEYRNFLMESIFAQLENMVMLGLLAVMAYILHRKRKLSIK